MFASAQHRLSPGAAATLACIYEATAPKPGNVHPGACFDNVSYAEFVTAAVVIGPIFDQVLERGVGQTVLDAVRATRDAVGTNTNLGTLLLIAPLAAMPPGVLPAEGIDEVLSRLSQDDTRLVYDAIRLSSAGGLGRVEKADVHEGARVNLSLVEAMHLAADRDLVARQYTNGFIDVLSGTATSIADRLERGWPLGESIVWAHVKQMAACPDSLIARKCGRQLADEAQTRAIEVLQSGMPKDPAFHRALNDFDVWLRGDGHRRNPGTTADLVAAGLFVLLREGRLNWTAW